MKKWSLILWFAVIVGSALIFTGCDGDDSDEGGGETFTDVSLYYSLTQGEGSTDADKSGLTIASALKSNSTGDITIVLTGKVNADYLVTATESPYADAGSKSTVSLGDSLSGTTNWTDNMWGSPTTLAGAEPGVYGAAYIDGLITRPIAAQTVAIRQTNEALRLYAGYEDTATSKPTAPVVPSSGYVPTALWIPGREDTPVRWKAYVDGSTKEADLSAGPFGVLLWDGGTEIPPYSNKTAILEVETITIAADGSATVGDLLARYIIDYSGVEFDITASYRLADSDSGISVIGNSTNLNAAAAQSTDANGKPVITVTLTNKTGQTFTGKDDFNSGGATNGLWGGKVSGAPNSWKYADISVNVGKLFADLSGKILSVKSTNHAFRYYKGAPNIWAAAPDKPTIGDPNIYIPTSDTELPIKWKIYAADRFDISTTWGIILSGQAPEKVVTIEIREHSSIPTGNPHETGTSTSNADDLAADAGTLLKTFKINYSEVTIN